MHFICLSKVSFIWLLVIFGCFVMESAHFIRILAMFGVGKVFNLSV